MDGSGGEQGFGLGGSAPVVAQVRSGLVHPGASDLIGEGAASKGPLQHAEWQVSECGSGERLGGVDRADDDAVHVQPFAGVCGPDPDVQVGAEAPVEPAELSDQDHPVALEVDRGRCWVHGRTIALRRPGMQLLAV